MGSKNDKKLHLENSKQILKMEESYEYMLPQPKDMQGYKEVMENMPQQILDITKNEQSFRHKFTYRAMHLELIPEIIGLLIGGTIAIGGLFITYNLITGGQAIAGVTLMLGEISILAGVFVYGNKNKEIIKGKTQKKIN